MCAWLPSLVVPQLAQLDVLLSTGHLLLLQAPKLEAQSSHVLLPMANHHTILHAIVHHPTSQHHETKCPKSQSAMYHRPKTVACTHVHSWRMPKKNDISDQAAVHPTRSVRPC